MESFIPFALMKKACGHCLYHKVQFLTIFCAFDKKLSNSQKLYTIETIPMHGMVPKDLQVMNYTLVWVVFGPAIHAMITLVLFHVSVGCGNQSSRTEYIFVTC